MRLSAPAGNDRYPERYKYRLCHCIDRIEAETCDRTPTVVPTRVIPELYVPASEFLSGDVDYSALAD